MKKIISAVLLASLFIGGNAVYAVEKGTSFAQKTERTFEVEGGHTFLKDYYSALISGNGEGIIKQISEDSPAKEKVLKKIEEQKKSGEELKEFKIEEVKRKSGDESGGTLDFTFSYIKGKNKTYNIYGTLDYVKEKGYFKVIDMVTSSDYEAMDDNGTILEPSFLDESINFFGGMKYYSTISVSEIHLPYYGFTIRIPEEWKDKVYMVINEDTVYIMPIGINELEGNKGKADLYEVSSISIDKKMEKEEIPRSYFFSSENFAIRVLGRTDTPLTGDGSEKEKEYELLNKSIVSSKEIIKWFIADDENISITPMK